MDENVKEATGYVAWCPDGCGWKSNLAITAEDAEESLNDHRQWHQEQADAEALAESLASRQELEDEAVNDG